MIEDLVKEALSQVAPEADPATLRPDQPLREQLDLDSFDFLQLMIRVHEKTGVEIPEADYGRLSTLADLVAYLESHRS
jgi:acyl carrier protein